jgi:hypothetical protein
MCARLWQVHLSDFSADGRNLTFCLRSYSIVCLPGLPGFDKVRLFQRNLC